jgi:formamidopyrimidine-DNA glycosylase
MPELPEVETVARGLQASLVGRVIVRTEILWVRSVAAPDPTAFSQRVKNQSVEAVERRGKWLAITLGSGDTLLIHLRMTGRLVVESHPCLDRRHLRAVFLLDNGQRLSFVDQRKFGRLHLTAHPQEILGSLGPEPLSTTFTPDRFREMLLQRHGRIKPLLLDQHFVAGLGNIYTDEALWKAGIHPLRQANTLSGEEVRRLHAAIQAVLRAAIASGGTTLQDEAYQRIDGRAGEYSERLAVYGRDGQRCPRCAETITRITVGQRGTHFCPHCQPLAAPDER